MGRDKARHCGDLSSRLKGVTIVLSFFVASPPPSLSSLKSCPSLSSTFRRRLKIINLHNPNRIGEASNTLEFGNYTLIVR